MKAQEIQRIVKFSAFPSFPKHHVETGALDGFFDDYLSSVFTTIFRFPISTYRRMGS